MHISPVQALKDWHAKKPELFNKRIYHQPGLDTLQTHLNLSQTELAEVLSTCASAVCKRETGEKHLSGPSFK